MHAGNILLHGTATCPDDLQLGEGTLSHVSAGTRTDTRSHFIP